MRYDDLDSPANHCPDCYTDQCDHHSLQSTYNSGMLIIHPSSAWRSAPLPGDIVHWKPFAHCGLLEYNSLYYLTVKRVINWCPSLSVLYPVLTAGILLLSMFSKFSSSFRVLLIIFCMMWSHIMHAVKLNQVIQQIHNKLNK